MGRGRYAYGEADSPHFLTCTVLHWIPVFTRAETRDILLDSLRFLGKEGLRVFAYVILENHMHLVAQSPKLDENMARFKSFTARQILDYLREQRQITILDQLAHYKKQHKKDRQFQFWQEGNHPEMILDDEMMRQKIEYIHNNPVARGYVELPEHWRYSSAVDYAGGKGLLEVCQEW